MKDRPLAAARFRATLALSRLLPISGLNHTGWTVEHEYGGDDLFALIRDADARRRREPSPDPQSDRMLHLAATMGSLPSAYLDYYYFQRQWQWHAQSQAEN